MHGRIGGKLEREQWRIIYGAIFDSGTFQNYALFFPPILISIV